jgi:hypothetical protein
LCRACLACKNTTHKKKSGRGLGVAEEGDIADSGDEYAVDNNGDDEPLAEGNNDDDNKYAIGNDSVDKPLAKGDDEYDALSAPPTREHALRVSA